MMIDRVGRVYEVIGAIITNSDVTEDKFHAINTLKWLLCLKPDADQALRLAAFSHDIDRAVRQVGKKHNEYSNYNAFKAEHAKNSADILETVLFTFSLEDTLIEKTCRVVRQHETGGEHNSDLLKTADSISFFDTNLPFYHQREGDEETLRRCIWGLGRLAKRERFVVCEIQHKDKHLNFLVQQAMNVFHKI